MKRSTRTESGPVGALRRVALGFPEAQEGTTCSKSSFRARNKAFLFVGVDGNSYNAMVKLRDSLPEAASLASKEPDHYAVGGHDWVTVTFGHDEAPPPGVLERWIDESYRLLVHKQLVAMLPERGPPAAGSARTGSRRSQAEPRKESRKRAQDETRKRPAAPS